MMAMFTPGGTRVSASVSSTDFRLKGKDHEGIRNPFLNNTIKREYSTTRQQWEYVERSFDKLTRTYRETYRDLVTGEVTFEKIASLDDQSVHGRRARKAE